MPYAAPEEPRRFAMTAGLAGQSAEAFQVVGDIQVRGQPDGGRERVVGVAFGLLWLTLCGRDPGTDGQRRRHDSALGCRDGFVGPAPSRGQIPARQRGLCNGGAQVRRISRKSTPVLPGRRRRVPRRLNIAGGQGRVAQRKVTNAHGERAKLGCGLEADVGRGSGRVRLTL